MAGNPAGYEWSQGRGEKWRDHAAGMEATLKPIDEPLVAALQLDARYRIADVGCGAGGTTFELARSAPAGSSVRGFDISPALVEMARARTQADPRVAASDIAFENVDIATFMPQAHFDRLTSRFGIMFFERPGEAFRNLSRWLAPGARFAFAVWGPMSENPWIACVRDLVASVADLPAPEPDAPGPFRYADADRLLALLAHCGLTALEVKFWRGALAVGGGLPPEHAAQFALAAFSSFAEALAKAGDSARATATRAVTESFARHMTGGTVLLDASVHIVTGQAPT